MNVTHGLMDGQVLQRQRNQRANATVKGVCSDDGVVRATVSHRGRPLAGWNGRAVGRARRGRFTARLAGIPVGGPYEVTLRVEAESVKACRLWVGDVWLLGGQSNMQGCGRLEGAPTPHPLVHAMYMDDHWDMAREPLHVLADSPDRVHWSACGPSRPTREQRDRLVRASKTGVGPGIFFGREMVRRSGGVPQGLLCVAHGGTSMEMWDPAKKRLGGDSLYGSMLRTWRKTGQPVAGVLWYQGESDCLAQSAPQYTARMKRFVAALRRDLGQPRLPFLMVQIGRVFGTAWEARWWNSVQNQQAKLSRQIPHLACVSAVDLPLTDSIHIASEGHARLGRRLARLADRLVYGNRRELPAPELADIRQVDRLRTQKEGFSRYRLTFRHVVGGLRAAGEPSGFDLVDGEHQAARAFYKTALQGNRVILETVLFNQGEYGLMYGHGCSPYVNITDGRDMPLAVFGPERIERLMSYSPFLRTWLVSRILPSKKPVGEWQAPRPSPDLRLQRRTYGTNFVDEHLNWGGKSGQCVFFSEVSLSEPMRLNLRLGYDGPIKVWVDERPVYCDPNGTNPAIPDQGIVPLRLPQGRHRLAVVMDLNGGRAWGFFLRFDRPGVSPSRIARGDYAVPICSLKE